MAVISVQLNNKALRTPIFHQLPGQDKLTIFNFISTFIEFRSIIQMNAKLFPVLLLHIFPILLSGQTEVIPGVKDQIDSLIKSARHLAAKQKYEQSLVVMELADSISLKHFDYYSEIYGTVCHNKGRVYDFKGDFKNAIVWYEKGMLIREKILGKEHVDFAWSLNNLAYVYQELGEFKKSESYYLEARSIRERVLGVAHPDYAASLNNLAILNWKLGKYSTAEQYYLEAKSIRERTLGKEHQDYIQVLINLGALYSNMSRYEEAESLYLESLSIQESLKDPDLSNYVLLLNNLGGLYQKLGLLEKSLTFAKKAYELYLKSFGINHPDYARSLGTLAKCYLLMGDFKESEKYYSQQLSSSIKIYGDAHPEIAACLSSLAVVYSRLSNYNKAEELYLKAKSIREYKYGKEHPKYGESLNNLGVLYWKMKQYEKAESLYLETEILRKKLLGEQHEDYAGILNNLGGLYADMGQYDKAEIYLFKSLKLKETHLGKEHPLYSNSLQNIAEFYKLKGDFKEAESYARKALNLRERIYGKDHGSYLESLFILAFILEEQGRFQESPSLLREYFAGTDKEKRKACSYLSEQELNYLVDHYQYDLELMSSFQLNRIKSGADSNALPALIYNQLLFQKGFLLTAARRINLLFNSTEESRELSYQLKALRRRVSNEYAKPDLNRKLISELEEKTNSIERQLASVLHEYENEIKTPEWHHIRDILKPGEACIEFVHFPVVYPEYKDSMIYAALIIKPGITEPLFIPLFEEMSLDSLLFLKEERRADYVNSLYSLGQRGANRIDNKIRSLSELIYQPLALALKNIQTIYYSSSGLLHQINLNAITLSPNESFADRYKLVEMLSSRQLISQRDSFIENLSAMLFGGIQYDSSSQMFVTNLRDTIISDETISYVKDKPEMRGGLWEYIPGTEVEIEAIGKILVNSGIPSSIKTGYDATEESFKQMDSNQRSPGIIHIATHGYFFSDPGLDVSKNYEGKESEFILKHRENPMFRSGLIMAGGNKFWKNFYTPENSEDGILTAYEISQLNFSNTELVVLSACETGLGDIRGHEGIYGLQRAFRIAGVKYILMSLWQVPDKQTSQLMIRFYKNWIQNKMYIREAFYTAQKEMRELGFDPYQWAGFVLIE